MTRANPAGLVLAFPLAGDPSQERFWQAGMTEKEGMASFHFPVFPV